MHESAPSLKAEVRERLGSRYARRTRDAGRLPAVVYGHGEQPQAIALDAKETLSHIHKGEKVFQLEMGNATQMVLLKDLQFDYLGNNVIHADFSRVDLQERVRSRVHIRLIGDAKGLKNAGTIMMHPATEIEIECPVVDLPEEIEVDVSELDEGGTITASQVPLPGSAKLLSDPNAQVAHITGQAAEVEVGEGEEVAAQDSPEVITEKKPEEGEG